MLYEFYFFLNTRRTQWITTQEKNRMQFLTDKTYVKAFQVLISDAPFLWLKLTEILKGWFKPCLPHEEKITAVQATADTFQSLSQREFSFLHVLPYNYAQGSTQNPRLLPLLHTSTINHLQRPFIQLCIITPPLQFTATLNSFVYSLGFWWPTNLLQVYYCKNQQHLHNVTCLMTLLHSTNAVKTWTSPQANPQWKLLNPFLSEFCTMKGTSAKLQEKDCTSAWLETACEEEAKEQLPGSKSRIGHVAHVSKSQIIIFTCETPARSRRNRYTLQLIVSETLFQREEEPALISVFPHCFSCFVR